MKTLKEVSEMIGMSRRVIQEYEKAGGIAVTPKTKNKYGHLLYDDQAIERLWQIRFYKELGYNKRKIQAVFNNPAFDRQQALQVQIELLQEKIEHLERLIKIAEGMAETGVGPGAIRFGIQGMDLLPFDDFYALLGAVLNKLLSNPRLEIESTEEITDADEELASEALEKIVHLADENPDYSSPEVQDQVAIIHRKVAKDFSDSIMCFFIPFTALFAPGNDNAYEIDKVYGSGKARYLHNALQFYCHSHMDNPTDREVIEALETIPKLGTKRYSADSDEVQAEVLKIYNFFGRIKGNSETEQLEVLIGMGELFGGKEFKKIIDKGADRGLAWFISRAIEIFCNKLEKAKT